MQVTPHIARRPGTTLAPALIVLAALCAPALPAPPAAAQSAMKFSSEDLELPAPAGDCAIIDLDGDGIDDLFVALGRRYLVIRGRATGKLAPAGPPRAFDPGVVSFDLARPPAGGGAVTAARGADGHVELDFHRSRAPAKATSTAGGDTPVFRGSFLYERANPPAVLMLGRAESRDHLAVVRRDADGGLAAGAAIVSLPREHRLHVSGADLLDRIVADTTAPGVALGDANGDGRADVIAVRPHRLDVYLRTADGKLPPVPSTHLSRPPRSPGTRLFRSTLAPLLRELGSDGQLAFLDVDANRGLIRLHPGPIVGEKAAPPRPLRFDGVLLDLTAVDADADGRLDLRLLVAENVTLVRAARMFVTQSVAVRALTFRQRADGSFANRADTRRDFSLPVVADLSVRPPRARPLPVWRYDTDLDGDGRADLAARVGRGRLGIHPAREDGGFAPDPAIELNLGGAPGSRPGAVHAGDLNGDGRADLAVVMEPGRSGRGRIRLFLSVAR